jgi:chorismate synthase
MLRWLTAGESHGPALSAIIEGLPAGIEVQTSDIDAALARRRLGFGRGARMKFEQDAVTITGGIRHGLTQGGPVAINIANSEWPKWQDVMSADPVSAQDLESIARNAPLLDHVQDMRTWRVCKSTHTLTHDQFWNALALGKLRLELLLVKLQSAF